MKTQKFKQTEIGKIPEDWEVFLAENFCKRVTDGTHESPKKKTKGKFLITSRHLKQNKLDFDNAYLISYEDFEEINKRSRVEQFDILFSMIGTVGEAYQEKENKIDYAIKNIGLFKFQGDQNKSNWFFYWLRSPPAKNYIQTRQAGSTQQYLTLEALRKFPLAIPKSLSEQKSIAQILSSLDAKIELNNKINKTLEAIGQALFKKWFVDEKKKEWEEGKLGDLLENIKESLKPGANLKDRKYVPIDLLSMKKISIESFLPYNKAKSSLIGFEKDDVLVGAMRVYFHRVNLAPFSGITRTTTFVLRPKNKKYLSYTLFLLNQNETIDFANANSKGSTMPYAVWNDSLENMPIIIPDDKTLKQFNELIYPLLSKIRDTIFENQTLSQIRDSLLPKLLSGKIRVPLEAKK